MHRSRVARTVLTYAAVIVCGFVLLLVAPVPSPGGSPVPSAGNQATAHGDPVARAKAFPKYGEALIKDARAAAKDGEYEKAEKLLTEYRDTVKQLRDSLHNSVSNPEKSPNGFKQLQIHVRKTIRDIDDLVASVPANLQPPFDFLRKEIDKIDRALIDDLFPRKPGREEKK